MQVDALRGVDDLVPDDLRPPRDSWRRHENRRSLMPVVNVLRFPDLLVHAGRTLWVLLGETPQAVLVADLFRRAEVELLNVVELDHGSSALSHADPRSVDAMECVAIQLGIRGPVIDSDPCVIGDPAPADPAVLTTMQSNRS